MFHKYEWQNHRTYPVPSDREIPPDNTSDCSWDFSQATKPRGRAARLTWFGPWFEVPAKALKRATKSSSFFFLFLKSYKISNLKYQ